MKTNTKHTPGPWYVSPLDSRQMICHDDGFVLALVSPSGKEQKANARLMAAAPELLEALEKIAEGTILDAGPNRLGRVKIGLEQMQGIARAALAKAVGGMETKDGWTEYPLAPDARGNFVEDLELIAQLLGSICYETETRNGKTYIRRVDQ